jgi:hypothetical protein
MEEEAVTTLNGRRPDTKQAPLSVRVVAAAPERDDRLRLDEALGMLVGLMEPK